MSIRVYSERATLGTCRDQQRTPEPWIKFNQHDTTPAASGGTSTHVAVVGGWGQVLVLLAGEDVNAHEVALGVAVLASLGGRNIGDLHPRSQTSEKQKALEWQKLFVQIGCMP